MDKIGIGPGMSISLHEDGRTEWRGGTKEEVFRRATHCLDIANFPAPKLDAIRRWVDLVSGEIEEDELHKRVQNAAELRLAPARKFLLHGKPKLPLVVDALESILLEEERKKLKKPE